MQIYNNSGIENLHPTVWRHSVAYLNEIYSYLNFMRKVAGEGFQVNKGHFFFYLHATDYDSKKIGKILLLIQINTVTLIEQTETKPPETLEFKLR